MLAVLTLWAALQDDSAMLRRLGEFVEQLGSDEIEIRDRAAEGILGLPAQLSPRLEELAAKAVEPEVAARLRSYALPPPWVAVLGGTLREARSRLAAIEGRDASARHKAIVAVLGELGIRPPGEAAAALAGLLNLESDRARDFALEGLARFPPKDLAPVVRMLEDEKYASRAAPILLRARDPAVLPRVSELFLKTASKEAGQVLSVLGAPEADLERIIELARTNPSLRAVAMRIVARSEPRRAEEILIAFLKAETKDGAAQDILDVLATLGGEKSIEAVRAWTKDKEASVDEVRVALRDPQLGREWLALVRKNPPDLDDERLLQAASFSGPSLRKDVRDWLAEPGLKLGGRKKALLLLGAVGSREDAATLMSSLKDPRLLEPTAEALDMIGDPASAAGLVEALKRAPRFTEGSRILQNLPAERVDGAIEEILADPHGYDHLLPGALALISRHTSERSREALLEGLSTPSAFWGSQRATAIRILAGAGIKADHPAVVRLRANPEPAVESAGLFLAARAGDRDAARRLAALLADIRNSPPSLDAQLPIELLREDLWKPAVLDEWRKRPEWIWGPLYLAALGHPEAQAELRRTMDTYTRQGLGPRAFRARVEGGDLEPVLDWIEKLNRILTLEEESLIASRADDALRKRVLAKVQAAGPPSRSGLLSLLGRMAYVEAVPVYIEAIAGGRQGSEDGVVLSIQALGRLKRREAIPDLRPLLRTGDPATKEAAILALAELGDRASLPWITRLLDDPAEIPMTWRRQVNRDLEPKRRIWHAAMEAMAKLSGVPSEGASVAERRDFWRSWAAKNLDANR